MSSIRCGHCMSHHETTAEVRECSQVIPGRLHMPRPPRHNPQAPNASLTLARAQRIVLQSQVIHGDWDAATHVQYLRDEEGISPADIHIGAETAEQAVTRWMAANLSSGRVGILRAGV